MIYLDHAASSPVRERVLEQLTVSLKNDFANPSSSHSLGLKLREKIESARENILKSVSGERGFNLIFTSSATESNNMAIKGFRYSMDDSILYSPADHPSIVKPVNALNSVKISEFFLKEGGVIDNRQFPKNESGRVRLALLTFVNNLSGTENNIGEIAEELRSNFPGIIIHVDAVQGFGKLKIELEKWNVDSISVSSHKLGGPKGIAGLFIRKGVTLLPLMNGGGQESGLRPSTQAAPLITGFSEAVGEATRYMEDGIKKISYLKKSTKELLRKKIKDLIFPFESVATSPYILTFIVPGIPADMIVRHLEKEEIYVSTSSACSSGTRKSDRAFSALSIPEKYHNSVLRISFSENTNADETKIFSLKLEEIYNRLKKII